MCLKKTGREKKTIQLFFSVVSLKLIFPLHQPCLFLNCFYLELANYIKYIHIYIYSLFALFCREIEGDIHVDLPDVSYLKKNVMLFNIFIRIWHFIKTMVHLQFEETH